MCSISEYDVTTDMSKITMTLNDIDCTQQVHGCAAAENGYKAAVVWIALSEKAAGFWVAIPVRAAGFWVAIPSVVAGF